MAFASRIASAPVLSASCKIGLPASEGANEIVDRPVLWSTETKIRSGRVFRFPKYRRFDMITFGGYCERHHLEPHGGAK